MTQAKNQPSIESPCVRNCCLNSEDVCMGCGRQLEEILQWHGAANFEREAILMRASARLSQSPYTPNQH